MLPKQVQRAILPLFLVTLALGFLYAGIIRYLADRYAHEGTREGIRKAIRLNPGNAQYHFAYARLLALIDLDAEKSILEFKEAIRLNPHDSRYWLGLAMAYRFTGNEKEEKRALDEAYRVDPKTSNVTKEIGDFYLLKGDVRRALELYQVDFSWEPKRRFEYFETAWKATDGDGKTIFETLIPDDPTMRDQLLVYSIGRGYSGARGVWEKLMLTSTPVPTQHVIGYISYMLRLKQWGAARDAWNQWTFRGHEDFHFQNGFVHGDFESDSFLGGFDWYTSARPETLAVSHDSIDFHSGNNSVLLEYKSQTYKGNYGLSQVVLIRPSSRYRLLFWSKPTELASVSPPRIEVLDADTQTLLASSKEITGTYAWTEHNLTFKTLEGGKAIIVQVSHETPGKEIRGRLNLDDFRLKTAP